MSYRHFVGQCLPQPPFAVVHDPLCYTDDFGYCMVPSQYLHVVYHPCIRTVYVPSHPHVPTCVGLPDQRNPLLTFRRPIRKHQSDGLVSECFQRNLCFAYVFDGICQHGNQCKYNHAVPYSSSRNRRYRRAYPSLHSDHSNESQLIDERSYSTHGMTTPTERALVPRSFHPMLFPNTTPLLPSSDCDPSFTSSACEGMTSESYASTAYPTQLPLFSTRSTLPDIDASSAYQSHMRDNYWYHSRYIPQFKPFHTIFPGSSPYSLMVLSESENLATVNTTGSGDSMFPFLSGTISESEKQNEASMETGQSKETEGNLAESEDTKSLHKLDDADISTFEDRNIKNFYRSCKHDPIFGGYIDDDS